MDGLALTGVRCFQSSSTRIRPLTILIGENSTGKTTFLAMLRLAWDLASARANVDFNEDPFRLGAYDEIAYYHGGQGKRTAEFQIESWEVLAAAEGKAVANKVHYASKFHNVAGQPRVVSSRLSSPDVELGLSWGVKDKGPTLSGTIQGQRFSLSELPLLKAVLDTTGDMWQVLALLGLMTKTQGAAARPTPDQVTSLVKRITELRGTVPRPLACAPIRTEPHRTYDPIQETRQAAGGHVPMILARLAATEPEAWRGLTENLRAFGVASGLFRGVRIRRARPDKASDPFQVMVDIEGQRAPVNLIDVGYGVSQVLPLLVDALLQPKGWLLVQQPEVHLHPRAQAELGSFLAAMVAKGGRFTVETHSDFLVDRICIEVQEGARLRPEDVLILFFERTGSNVTIHELEIDRQGNISGAPPTYRQFFQREQDRFLGQSS